LHEQLSDRQRGHNRRSRASAQRSPTERTWPHRAVAIAYAASALIVFASIPVQFVTAGTAMFAPQAGGGWDERWQAHVTYGSTGILVGSIFLIALSFAARQPWRWTGVAALVLVLFFVQSLLIQLYRTGDPVLQLIASLHIVSAGVILWLGFGLLGRGFDVGRSALRR
jgi:hypothetical protein